MKKKLGILLAAAFCLFSCDSSKSSIDIKTEQEFAEKIIGSKYKINRIAVLPDNLAYNGKRGVYEICNIKGELIYFGISGIGVSDRGSHTKSDGEDTSTVQDER